jgi:signal transduction histidine kinase
MSKTSAEPPTNFPLSNYSDTQGITRIFYWFIIAILVSLVASILIVLSNQEIRTALIPVAGLPFVLASLIFVRRGNFEWAATFLAIILFNLITVAATTGLGIHHLSNLAFPVILIVCSLVTRQRTMVFLTLYAVGCVAWLVFGELAGLYTPLVLKHSVPGDFFTAVLIIVLTATMVRWLSEALFNSLRQLRQELAERQLAEQKLEQDIALRLQAEEALRRLNEKLEERVAARTEQLQMVNETLTRTAQLRDDFLASMSHELRTPLTTILALAQSLHMQTVYGSLTEKQLKAAKSIEDSGKHLLALINDMLDLSKLEAGKVELELDSVTVDEVGQASLALVKEMADAKHQTVSYTLQPPDLRLLADARQLKQMLVNLLSNAVKFTPAGGTFGLEISGDSAQQVVHFTVWDKGIGIAPENLPRLFESFVQLDARLAREYSGTGLGLALVRRMAELHGGQVKVESEVGAGSRFTLALPWITGEVAAPGVLN